MEKKRQPIIAIRVDEDLYQRWNDLDKVLHHGMKTWAAREWLRKLIYNLEQDSKRIIGELSTAATGTGT